MGRRSEEAALMEEVFGEGGLLCRHHPQYEYRPGQIRMAEAVYRALVEGGHLLVEAGTGTGKTLAYLVPALAVSERIIISTGTKNLQEQLLLKDIPFLEKALGRKLRVASMKGRSNYVCLYRLKRAETQPILADLEEAKYFDEIRRWAFQSETGDRAELADVPENLSFWSSIDARSEICLGQKCPDYDACFITKMRERALKADIVIVNHHLFFADLALREAPTLLRLAELRLHGGRKEEAAQTLKRLSSIPDKSYRPVYALFLLNEGKTAEGIAELERLHRADPADRNVRSRLVAAYLTTNRAPDAQRILDEAIKRNPRDTQALLQRGALLGRLGKWQEAEQDLVKVLRIEPESAEAHYHLAAVRRGQGEAATAKQELAEAIRLSPSLLAARLELAALLLAEKSAQAALDLLERAPLAQKSDIRFIVTRNSALMALGDFAKAREGVKQGLAIARTSELLTQDGNLRLLAKDFAGARKSLEEALERNPENVAALDLLASSFLIEKQPEAALARVRKHAQAHPDSPAAQHREPRRNLSNLGARPLARKRWLRRCASQPHHSPLQHAYAGDCAQARNRLPPAQARALRTQPCQLWQHRADGATARCRPRR